MEHSSQPDTLPERMGAPITFGLCAIAAYIIGSDTVIRRMKAFRA
ncbi:hypothetical protein [Bradyrhizobium elkanii]|nr:hypothetical protein [Bradyrhizobium elkanii]WLC04144.1 hypothetical protein QIH86_24185 [Bradyrhizobium elkanii USDA 94]